MQLIFVTWNSNKLQEARELLPDFDIQNESNGPVRYLEIYKCRLVGSSDSQMEINENICQPGSAIQSFIAGDFDDLDYIVFIFNHNM